jgi:hypothetical protein
MEKGQVAAPSGMRNTRNRLSAFFLAVAVATQGAMAASRTDGSSVTVLARGFAGLRIEGRSADVFVEQDSSALTFRIPIASIATGIELRDRHMRDLLEAGKFPAAVLRLPREELKYPTEQKPVEGSVRGELTLHGLSRTVEVKYRAELVGGRTRARGALQIDMREFRLRAPSYLGVTVAPEVRVDVEIEVPADAS